MSFRDKVTAVAVWVSMLGNGVAEIEPAGATPELRDPVTEDHAVVRLWPIDRIGGEKNRLKLDVTKRGKVRYENVKDPNLVVFPVEREGVTPAVVYCPGGGYVHITPKTPVIEWLNRNGVTVFMLRYTVPKDRNAAFRDVQRAVRMVRHRSERWNVDPGQLGVLGSSAGGHLVARLSQNYEDRAYPAFDEADRQSCEPNFVILTSAAYLVDGKGGGQQAMLAEEFPIKAKIAPTFLVYAKDDHKFVAGGVAYEKALRAAGIPTRILVSETGGHGLKDVNWYPECGEWLKGLAIDLQEK